MTGFPPAGFDPGELDSALASVNAARAIPADDLRYAAGSLRALEDVLRAATPADPVRAGMGDRALAELDELLAGAGDLEGAGRVRSYLAPIVDRLIEVILGRPEERLAAYGSLRPGESNHAMISTLVGEWRKGRVRGLLDDRGWGTTSGYPGFRREPSADWVDVEVFESRALTAHWGRLDAFEGSAYRRVLVPVETAAGVVVCNLYEAAGASRSP